MNKKQSFRLLILFFGVVRINLVHAQIFEPGQKINEQGLSYHSVVSFDADNDGDPDLLSFPTIYYNDGKGQKEGYRELLKSNYDFETFALADLDGNGFTDIVVLLKSGQILIFTNDKNGFKIRAQAKKLEYNPARYAKLSLVDINHDGITDIVFKGLINRSYMAFIGDSKLQYAYYAPFYSKFKNALSVLSADIDNDNLNELLVPNFRYRSAGNQLYYYQFSDGKYEVKDSIEVGTPYISHYKFYDIDGDGDEDLVYCPERGNKNVYYNLRNEKGSFDGFQVLFQDEGKESVSISGLTIGDYNSDKLADVALIIEGREKNSMAYIKQVKKGVFAADKPAKLPQSTRLNTFIFDDFNGDGLQDFAAFDAKQQHKQNLLNINIYNKSNRSFETESWIKDNRVTGFIFADFNNDGYEDIIAYYQSEIFCSFFQDSGKYSPYIEIGSAPFKILGLECAFIDSDRQWDILVCTDDRDNGKVGWLKNMDGKFLGKYNSIHDGPGRVIKFQPIQTSKKIEYDVVINYWTKKDRGLYIYKNMKNGNFSETPKTLIETQERLTYLTLLDLNSDDQTDIIELGSGTWFTYSSERGWTEDSLAFKGSSHHGLYPATLNHNKMKDIITPTFKNITWVENDSGKNWTEHMLFDNSSIKEIQVGDINCDGFDDIVCLSSNLEMVSPSYFSGEIAFSHKFALCTMINDGSGNFKVEKLYPIEKVNTLLLNDYDGDGDLDLITSSHFWPHSGVKIWKNNTKGQQ